MSGTGIKVCVWCGGCGGCGLMCKPIIVFSLVQTEQFGVFTGSLMAMYLSNRGILHLDSCGTSMGLCTTSKNCDIRLAPGLSFVSIFMFKILLPVLVLASLPTILATTATSLLWLDNRGR